MLINLVPEFLAALQSAEPVAAYHRYLDTHRALLGAYWHNYVIEPSGPHFLEVVRDTVRAERNDLYTLLERTDVAALAARTEAACVEAFEIDSRIDVVLMVGVGAANAGELVVDGRAVAFVCLEHFTSVANPATRGLGLDPELIPMWLAHEIAHGVRYTAPGSRAELRRAVDDADGSYSYWETGRRVSLREHPSTRASRSPPLGRSAPATPRGSTSATTESSMRGSASSNRSSRMSWSTISTVLA